MESRIPRVALAVAAFTVAGATIAAERMQPVKVRFEDVTQPKPRPPSADEPGMKKEVKKHATDWK